MVRLPYLTALTTLFSYGLLFAFGQLRDLIRNPKTFSGYAPIYLGLEDFYTHRLYLCIHGLGAVEILLFSFTALLSWDLLLHLVRRLGVIYEETGWYIASETLTQARARLLVAKNHSCRSRKRMRNRFGKMQRGEAVNAWHKLEKLVGDH